MNHTKHTDMAEGLSGKKGAGISSNRIYLLFGINLLGFILVFALDRVVGNLIDDLNEQLRNEQSRVFIGEMLSNDLARLEAKTYQMATTSGEKAQAWIYQDIELIVAQLNEGLNVLEQGGEIVRETRLNIESQEKMVRRFVYQPEDAREYVLEAIDLKPKLNHVSGKVFDLLALLGKRDRLDKQADSDSYISAITEVKLYLQSFPPLFTRMKENANRLFYESQQELDGIRADISKRENHYFVVQMLLSLLIIGAVLFIGLRVLRQVDNSNRKLRELARNLELQKYALDQHAIVSITDVQGNITYANDKFCEISGFQREELIGRNHRIVKSGRHSQEFYRSMWETISRGKTWHGEVMNRARGGGSYWVAATIVPYLGENGKPFQYISIRTDITNRKLMEEDIQESNRFLTSLTDTMGEGVYAQDAEGNCRFLNPEAEKLLGWSLDELKEHGIHELIHHQLDECGHKEPSERCNIRKTVSRGEVYRSVDEEFIHRDGRVFPVSLVSVPLFNEGKMSGSVTVFHDFSHRREMEQMLASAKESAEKANQAKSEFLSSMSHELRTPLNAILGFSQLLKAEQLADEHSDLISEINHAGEHLLGLINEILDLARIESGRLELSLEPLAIQRIVDDCISLTKPLADKREITINVKYGPEGLWLKADRTRFKQALLNLMSNGIKYNRDGGTLTLTIAKSDDEKMVTISVTDTGNGMGPAQQAKLFQPFERLGQDATATEGTGIGLVITKELIHLMGGEIGVESTAGEGSTFWFELPLAEAVAATTESGGEELVARSAMPADESMHHTTVLYIDDNSVNLKLVEKFLQKRADVSLYTAQQPRKGLAMAAEILPDLILLDINMPEMDGYQVLEQLLVNTQTCHIPVVGLSANAMPSDIERATNAGFSDYLTKPLKIKELFAAIERNGRTTVHQTAT